jgi:MFS family permease
VTLRIQEVRSLLRHHDLRVLWVAQILSEVGDWAARLALAVLVFDRTGSPALTALATAVSVLPWVGIGQILATFGDRRPRRSVMVTADVVRAAVFLAMVLPMPVWTLLLLAFVAGAAAPPFETARSALLPTTVPPDRYGDAIAVTSMTYQLSIVAGYLTGGGLVALAGPSLALTVNAGSFAASALMLLRLHGGRSKPKQMSISVNLRSGFAAIFQDPFVRRAVLFSTLVGSLAVMGESLVPVYVKDELGGSGATLGVVAACIPVGAILASGIVRIRGGPVQLLRLSAMIALAGSLVSAIGFAADPALPWAAIPFLGLGIAFASGLPANAVAGTRLPDAVRSSAFGILMGCMQGAAAISVGAGGYLASRVGTREACATALALSAVLSAWAALRPARPIAEADGSQPATELV